MAPVYIFVQSMTDDRYCPDWWYSADIEDMVNFVGRNVAQFCNLGLTNLSNLGLFCKKILFIVYNWTLSNLSYVTFQGNSEICSHKAGDCLIQV